MTTPQIVDQRGNPISSADFTRASANARRVGQGSLTQGGITNLTSGAGTMLDKSEGSYFTPTRIYWRSPLEILCVQSWAAANFVDIPVDDMFIRWRTFSGDDDAAIEAMEEAEKRHKVQTALRHAMVAARQYGTGCVIIKTREAPMEEPLNIDRIREGDIIDLDWFDRYDMSVYLRQSDFYEKDYGTPIWYDVHPSYGGTPMRVHHTRVLRFDGIRPPTKSGFYNYDQDFGVSNLVPVIVNVLHDALGVSAVAHMMQEASIPVLHIAGLRETIAGMGSPDEPSPAQIGQAINQAKSIYRLLMLDESGREEFMRVAVQFGGLADIMDRFSARLASAAKIPRTRFLGASPIGMNATGDSDMDNYVMMMEATRAMMLRDPLERLDVILARDAGMREPPEYDWQSLLELSDKEVAEAAKIKAEALDIAVRNYAMEEGEMRTALDGDPVFGPLPGDPPERPDPMVDLPPISNNNPLESAP